MNFLSRPTCLILFLHIFLARGQCGVGLNWTFYSFTDNLPGFLWLNALECGRMGCVRASVGLIPASRVLFYYFYFLSQKLIDATERTNERSKSIYWFASGEGGRSGLRVPTSEL